MCKLCKGFIFILIVFSFFILKKSAFASNAYFVWEKTEITVPVYSSLQEFKDDYVLKLYVNGKLSNDYYVEYETNCSTFTTVLTNKVGRYTVYYKAYSKNNNISSEQAIIFNVVDISAPTITLDGNTLTINKGDKITDYSFYTVIDDTTNFNEIKIEIDDSNVIYNVLGTYPATIKATDLYNNISKVNFYVKIVDNLPPKFTIIKPLVDSVIVSETIHEAKPTLTSDSVAKIITT